MSRFHVVEHIVRSQHSRDRAAGAERGRENELVLHVKQYIPQNNARPQPGDVTIVGAVANAYPKEIQEPLWDDLVDSLRVKGRNVRSIWIADPVNTGRSGVLNEAIVGPDPSWLDHGRDLLFLINQFQDHMPHPIIGIGHSMGASHLKHLALLHPRLLDALILIDPVIQRIGGGQEWAAASTNRRDLWPSRQAAAEKLRSHKAFQTWDPRVLDKYIDGQRSLPELRPRTMFIFGAKSEVSSPEAIEDKLAIIGTAPGGSGGRAKAQVQATVVDCGHLVPLEKPKETAEACAVFVNAQLTRWGSEQKEQATRLEKLSRRERVDINDLWREKVGLPPGKAKKVTGKEVKL